MDIHITNRHGKLNDEEHAAAVAASTHFQHYFEDIIRVDAILNDDGVEKECEFTVKIPDHTVVAHEKAHDFTKAIHDAAEKMKRQLIKMNERRHDTRSSISRP